MRTLAVAALALGLTGLATADDKKANPTGTWKWETEFGGQKRTQTLKLKLEGDKLTGAMIGRNDMETKIEDAKFKDGEVTFSVTRERQGQKFTSKYKAKVEGDTMKGTIERERDGQTQKQEFEAKREKETKDK
jgi:hypothetical protein